MLHRCNESQPKFTAKVAPGHAPIWTGDCWSKDYLSHLHEWARHDRVEGQNMDNEGSSSRTVGTKKRKRGGTGKGNARPCKRVVVQDDTRTREPFIYIP